MQNWTKLWNFISHDEFCNIHCIFVCRPTVYHSGECNFISRKPREIDTQIFTWLYLYYSAIRLWRNYVNIRKCWYTMYRYIGEVEINKKYMYFHSGIFPEDQVYVCICISFFIYTQQITLIIMNLLDHSHPANHTIWQTLS